MRFDRNDDHALRTLKATAAQQNPQERNPQKRISAGDAFIKWLNQRLPSENRNGAAPYPVFIVSAEGGGMYAAYNTAIFLSRMQDLCPDFHNHLFAISSVSGGSVGAATFTAAIDAIGQPKSLVEYSTDPCPTITQFLSKSRANDSLDEAGPTEVMVDAALSSDFLSPLIAATLFNDFSQQVTPFALGFLDRARALEEYALEDSTDTIYQSAISVTKPNILRGAFQDYWTPEGPLPALLFNATDTGSGKRVVIAPFNINADNYTGSDVCDFAAQNDSTRFAISTAAFVSARFPWVTPAASSYTVNSCEGHSEKNPISKIRLVDGGYIDKPGIETALNVLDQIRSVAKQNNLENSFSVYLISLSGGDFPNSRGYSLGEIEEPIRALLNGREARAYVAINRAQSMLGPNPNAEELPRFNVTKLKNNFYALPLGWAISSKTREIIALDSGRFWDCVAGKNFQQTDPLKSNADCVQLQVYHLLNKSTDTALDDLNNAATVAEKVKALPRQLRQTQLDHETLLKCYESNWWQKKKSPVPGRTRYLLGYQAEYLDELLNERDRLGNIDHQVLAYILGSLSYDSDDFRRTADILDFKSQGEALRLWKNQIDLINRHRANAKPPSPPVVLSDFMNKPKEFAELVWGWEGNSFGNNKTADGKWDPNMGQGWRYRERGIYQLVGYKQYAEDAKWLRDDDPSFPIDLVQEPDALSNPTVSARVAFARFKNMKSDSTKVDERISQLHARSLFGMTLLDVLKTHPGNFEDARLNQLDVDADSKDIKAVSERSTMFVNCINEATQGVTKEH